jgi:DNA-binding protein YbaB
MFGKMGEMKQMYSKYKKLQDKLKNLIIRAKQGKYTNTDGEDVEGAVVIDITGEMKLKDITINDFSLLSVERKDVLESTIKDAFVKAQTKAQEVVQEQTKEILGFDPSQLAGMM